MASDAIWAVLMTVTSTEEHGTDLGWALATHLTWWTTVMVNSFWGTYEYICIFYHFTTLRWCMWLKSYPVKDKDLFFLHLSHEYRVVRIDIHSCYSVLVNIVFAPICPCKNNRRIWRHNVSTSPSHDVIDQLWWHHNAKSEKTAFSDNDEMSNRWLFLAEWCVKDIK